MKGILGLGKESTQYYISQIHEKYNKTNLEFSTCPMLIYQVDFQELNPFLPNQFAVLKLRLQDYLDKIKVLGIMKLLIPNITLHETIDQLDLEIEICHPVDLTLDHLAKNNITGVTLFGTSYTMNSDHLRSRFADRNISVSSPDSNDQIWLDKFRKNVYSNTHNNEDTIKFHNLVKKYALESHVILACTELSVAAQKDNVMFTDMVELQIDDFLLTV